MKTTLAIVSVAALLCSGAAAFAQPAGGGMQALREACGADFAKICPDAKDHDSRRQCYLQNADKFSDTCKSALAATREQRRAGQSGGGR